MSPVFIRAAALARGMDSREAARELRSRAGLAPDEWARLPCLVGSSSHAIGAAESAPQARLAPPIDFARGLARAFEVSGPVLSASSACTSGLTALQLALDLIDAGAFRHALVLGVEVGNRLTLEGFRGLGLVPGMVLGEALGAVLVSRAGPWRIASLAWQLDPSSLFGVAADGDTLARATRDAISAAGWSPSDVELRVPQDLSMKDELGHTLGASGPAELALLLEKLEKRSERRVLFSLAGFGGSIAAMALERTA